MGHQIYCLKPEGQFFLGHLLRNRRDETSTPPPGSVINSLDDSASSETLVLYSGIFTGVLTQ